MKRSLRDILIVQIVASYIAATSFAALEVFRYRPIFYSNPDARKGIIAVAIAGPLTGPLLLFGTPLGLALHHRVPHVSWVAVAIPYLAVELLLVRAYCNRRL